MVKKLQLIVLFVLCLSVGLFAQTVVVSDQFDSGDGLWGGWIDGGNTTVAVGIDTNDVLSGKNSYLVDIGDGSADTWRIQRNTDCPLLAGNVYTLSFLAVADTQAASINVLFEIEGSPYTKRLNETADVDTLAQVFTYSMVATEDVSDNELKLHFGGLNNNGAKIWIDSVIVTRVADPALVGDWGKTAQGTAWPIDTTRNAGDAGLGDGAVPTGWSTVRGAFADLTATTSEAVVVSGKLEYMGGGGGSAYTHLRYALTYADSLELQYQYTDSAEWVTTADSSDNQNKHTGYGFHPRSGTADISNGAGGQGMVWTLNRGNWNSTWSNNGGPLTTVLQTPRNAEMVAGVYDFAISVHVIDDTTNEIRWSLVDENSDTYWFAGTTVGEATTQIFNGVCFGFNNDASYTGIKITGVRARLDDPIEIPEPIWEAYYLDLWGKTAQGTAWPINNVESTPVGSGLLGDGNVPTGWSTIRADFGQDLEVRTDRAVIVSGELEYVGGGGGSAYTHLRYALTYADSLELQHQYTDSAMWATTADSSDNQNKHTGYGFHPRSGTADISNGSGGQGTVWTLNKGNWNSTWSNNGGPVTTALQAPRNAEMVAGVYEWAISVHAIDDTTNEIRWYLIDDDKDTYWYGGTTVAEATTQIFNGVCFGFNNDASYTSVNITYCEVDLGDPITVPEPIWEAYYLDLWGKTAQGTAWPINNVEDTPVGSGLLGDGAVPTGWSTIRGAFGQDLEVRTDRAVIVSGELEYVGGGGGSAYTHLRYALTYADSLELQHQYTDSAMWATTADSSDNQNKHTGYGFHPRSGTADISNGAGGQGTVWTLNKGNWNSTWSNNGGPVITALQTPRNAEMTAGVYEWAISVHAIDDTTNEIRWYLIDDDGDTYWYGGTAVAEATTQIFNGVCFGFNNDASYTSVNITYCEVDLGDPITVVPPIWEDYYLEEWGFIGDRTGGWSNETNDVVGYINVSGENPASNWAAVRGEFFDPVDLADGFAYIVEGEMVLTDGGFEDMASLRLGLFYGDSAGTVAIDSALDSSLVWTGIESSHSGYLFLPHSGTNDMATWSVTGEAGTAGAIEDASWISTYTGTGYIIGDELQEPADAVAGAGTYEFRMGVQLLEDGTLDVGMHIDRGEDYVWESRAIDANDPLVTTMFNSVCFALNSSTATAMTLQYVELTRAADLGDLTSIEVNKVGQGIPTTFSLGQNYPNPFNPSTTIEFGLPKQSDVKIVVYDVLGQVVTELTNKKMNAGFHELKFNASRFSTGIYFYRIEAGDFVKVKKMMLLK